MSLVTSMIVLMPCNIALAQPTDGDGGTTGGGVTGGDGSTVSSPITIDGDFSDWAALEQDLPNACISASTDDNALYTGLYKAQFFVNGDSLFFYIEYSNSKQVQEAGTNYVTDMIHIMLHTGGLSTTGTTNYNDEDVWSDLANVRIIGSPRTQFANAYILVYQETDQTWETVQLPVSPISACTPVEEVTNDHAKTEGAIALSLLPVQIEALKVGVIGVETSYVTSGVLPQMSLNPTDGGKIIQPMLSLPWGSSSEPSSGMCGKNVSWTYTPLAKMLQISGRGAMDDFEDAAPDYADFQNDIQYVTVSEGVTYIGSRAFAGMTSLLTASLDSSVTSMGTYVFNNCTTLQYLQLPVHITTIPEGTFYYCSSLQGIEIPADVTSIGEVAFNECSQMEALVCYATTPPTLDANVFDGVPNTVTLYVPAESVTAYQSDQGWSYFTNIQAIPDETQLEDQSGMCGDKINWTLTGKTLTLNGGGEMWDFTPDNPATYAEFMERIDTVIMEGSVTKVSMYAFYHLENMKYIELSEYVDTIDTHAFESCYSLEHITLPNSVRHIGHDAFAYCSGLQSAILPAELKKIPANLFVFCRSLSRLQIPSTVTSIGDNAFYLCAKLQTVALSSELKEIYGGAFGGCTSLSQIQCEAVIPPALIDTADNPVFDNVPSTIPLYVRAKAVPNYQAAEGWNYFENIQPIDGDTLEPTEITVFGITITPGDSTNTDPVDLLGDGTMIYDIEENTLTVNGTEWTVGEEETVAINYTGDAPLTIVLEESSTIIADTIIASTANIVITGEGTLVAEGTVPIIGSPDATITFEANMHVRSLPSAAAVRRRIRDAKFGKKLDETGGPALSGFGSSDFSKVNVSPSGASYGEVPDESHGEAATINALYTLNGQGEKVIVTEFETTLIATGAEDVRERKALDSTKPMYNILGMQVDAKYKGIVVQDGQKYLLQ